MESGSKTLCFSNPSFYKENTGILLKNYNCFDRHMIFLSSTISNEMRPVICIYNLYNHSLDYEMSNHVKKIQTFMLLTTIYANRFNNEKPALVYKPSKESSLEKYYIILTTKFTFNITERGKPRWMISLQFSCIQTQSIVRLHYTDENIQREKAKESMKVVKK